MKKIFLSILFIFCATFCVNAQYNKHKYKSEIEPRIGLCITGAGLTFTVAGLLTPPDYTWVNSGTSSSAGYWKKKPFLEQGARSMCIVTGVTLTCTGLITMLAGR